MAKQAFMNTREEILGLSIPLFVKVGFDGVSMRDIAAAVGVTPATLYHHFSDKRHLYLDAVGYAFKEKVDPLKSLLDGEGKPWDRLEAFVAQLTRMLARKEDLRRLMQWVMLDSDEQRLKSLADCVFLDLFNALRNIAGELAPDHDAHLLIVSIIGLVIYPFETRSVLSLLPGYMRKNENPEAITRHVVDLLRNGLGENDEGKSQQRPASQPA